VPQTSDQDYLRRTVDSKVWAYRLKWRMVSIKFLSSPVSAFLRILYVFDRSECIELARSIVITFS
jgi:hypothetical protein